MRSLSISISTGSTAGCDHLTRGPDELWPGAAELIRSELGWSLRPLTQLSRRDDRRTWLVEGETGRLIVKATTNRRGLERTHRAAELLHTLRERGVPTPELLWWRPLDELWGVFIQSWLPGEPLDVLDRPLLENLIALLERQANVDVRPDDWNLSWWVGAVVFDGWENWWKDSERAAPQLARRLQSFLEPAEGASLPAADIVHGHISLRNVLARDGVITGIVDWDHVGVGTRALDFTGLLFNWQRLRVTYPTAATADGGQRLRGRILELAGDSGFRSLVCYMGIANLALSFRHREHEALKANRRAIEAILNDSSATLV
jgi:Ser/Thr protein kinase RdoA (MazF antagonist)